jgi:DNA topoisomerase-2
MTKKLKVEEIYEKLSQREHVLRRPDTYVGSISAVEEKMYVADPDTLPNPTIQKELVKYSPAFIKIFDEIITNASDHYIRSGKVKYIKVTVEADCITVENDGPGIPIEMHKKENMWVPELIFFNLLAGSNFDDTEQRFVGGRNGLGSKLTCIFSKKFIVETADGKKKYRQIVNDNLYHNISDNDFKPYFDQHSAPKITPCDKTYTKITFYPDFERFGMSGFDKDLIKILLKRTLDIAVYCPKAKVYFNGEVLPIKTMKDYMEMHLPEGSELFYEKLDNDWEVGIAKTQSESFEQVSIVNGITTYRGGTHVNYISLETSKDLAEMLTKGNKKMKVTWVDVKNKLFLFLICKIPNPTFDTQTKENLTNYINRDIHNGCKLSESVLKKIMKSEIIQSILDYIELKEQQELNRLQKSLASVKVEKLIDAKGKDRSECILGIFEGDAALKGVRKVREPNKFGAFPLKGKFLNVSELNASTVIKNEEVKNLISAIGIQLGSKINQDSLRYGKIYIYSDADTDGDSIASLLINFFYKYWPELFDQGRIYKVLTPLLVAIKGKEKKYFYTEEDYHEWESTVNIKQWLVEYKKGLGALEDDEYELIINNPVLAQITSDKLSEINLDVWFGKDSGKRKEKLMS